MLSFHICCEESIWRPGRVKYIVTHCIKKLYQRNLRYDLLQSIQGIIVRFSMDSARLLIVQLAIKRNAAFTDVVCTKVHYELCQSGSLDWVFCGTVHLQGLNHTWSTCGKKDSLLILCIDFMCKGNSMMKMLFFQNKLLRGGGHFIWEMHDCWPIRECTKVKDVQNKKQRKHINRGWGATKNSFESVFCFDGLI